MDFFKFVFRDFWTFLGFFVLACVVLALVKSLFDFIVELIHGKPAIQHINLPEGTKIEEKTKTPKATKDVNGSIDMKPAKVDIRSN